MRYSRGTRRSVPPPASLCAHPASRSTRVCPRATRSHAQHTRASVPSVPRHSQVTAPACCRHVKAQASWSRGGRWEKTRAIRWASSEAIACEE